MKNVYDIKLEKNLDYILPCNCKIKDIDLRVFLHNILVVVHLHYIDTFEYYLEYIDHIPSVIDIIITVSDNLLKSELEKTEIVKRKKIRIIIKKNRGRDISAFLVACRTEILQYKYVCFLHDKKEKQIDHKKDTEMWIRCLWENTIGSTKYIENIITTFFMNPTLGLLVPPNIISENFSTGYVNVWYGNFVLAKKLAKKMKLDCDLDCTKSPITTGTVFWARVSALRKLFEIEWKYDDFDEEPLPNDATLSHVIERILAYVAQDAGYETGWVMTDRFAAERFEYMQAIIQNAFKRLNMSLGILRISELNSYEKRQKIIKKFVDKYERFYIYGAGSYGKRCFCMLKDIQRKPEAFLISDINQNTKKVYGLPVYSISDIEICDRCGVIIAVSDKYKNEILDLIKKKNPFFSNIFIWK